MHFHLFRRKRKLNWLRWKTEILISLLIIILASLYVYAFKGAINANNLFEEGTTQVVTTEQLAKAFGGSTKALAVGTVVDTRGKPIKVATISLSVHGDNGEPVWRILRPVDEKGVFVIYENDLPPIQGKYAGIIAAEAPEYLAEKVNVVVEMVEDDSSKQSAESQQSNNSQQSIGSGQPNRSQQPAGSQQSNNSQQSVGSGQPNRSQQPAGSQQLNISGKRVLRPVITPSTINLPLKYYNKWLTLIVLFPAIFGLLYAILHMTKFSATSLTTTYTYAIGTTLLWGAAVAELVGVYVARGNDLVPLFFNDFFVSSGVVIFAFIGSMVYVAFSIYQQRPGFYFDAPICLKRHILLSMVGRVLVAPYIALTAYGVFAATFPNLRTGSSAAFFGLFTGLWIKVVLEALNDIGLRFLSKDAQEKVAARMARQDVASEPVPTGTTSGMKPDQAFLNAVALARQEFLKKEGVIGVAEGIKVSALAGGTGERAIIVYVYEKRDLPIGHLDRVPDTFMGYSTDVLPLPTSLPGEECYSVMFNVSWEKIYQDNEKRLALRASAPHASPISQPLGTNVLVLTDTSGTAFYSPTSDDFGKYFVIRKAYEQMADRLGDRYDFVAFVLDVDSFPDNVRTKFNTRDYAVSVFNDAAGIGFYKDPGRDQRYDMRTQWHSGITRLRACQVHIPPLSQRNFLHELGHTWCAYVTTPQVNLLHADGHHWHGLVDVGRSCMNYVKHEFIKNADGTYTRTSFPLEMYDFSCLDLYLMGIKKEEEVGDIRVFDPSPIDGLNKYRVAANLRVGEISSIYGLRHPPSSSAQRVFRQAFVVVSRNRVSGENLAIEVDKCRVQLEKDFARATGVWTLQTDIT